MDNSNINLGYTVRRAIRDKRDGLRVFRHDLSTFCIPQSKANQLSYFYRRYLWASGILDEGFDPDCDYELYQCDRQSLQFIHKRTKRELIDGHFFLEDAIEFVEAESGLPKALVIRWCMMMEYITYEDQRLALIPKNQEQADGHEAPQADHNDPKDEGTHDGN